MIQQLDYYDDPRKNVAYLSTYPPRECGIAIFTKNLIDATTKLARFEPSVIAINNKDKIHKYDQRVKFVIDRDQTEDYINAAEQINSSEIGLVVIQHEFGLYGGKCGGYIKYFLENLSKPVITILHTVQPNFGQEAIEVLRQLAGRSESIIVIAQAAIPMLKKQKIPYNKCVVIPHGCPNIDSLNNDSIKETLDLRGRLVASTFGLISSGKGIEYAIQALPEVIKKEPRIIYLIIGETHPEVKKREGEKYRNKLIDLVNNLGLKDHVKFINRFVTRKELIKFLQATDIYLTPYISPNQISSGSLTYALGAGKAVISTPYYHAQEVLANDRGILCKFEDSASIAVAINKLIDENFRNKMQKKAYKYSRRFLWQNVAKKYIKLFEEIENKS